MQGKTGQIRMHVALGDHGRTHEATCKVIRDEIVSAETMASDGSSLHRARSVMLTIHDPNAEKDFPIRVKLEAESATRLAADILDWLAPRTLLPRHPEDS